MNPYDRLALQKGTYEADEVNTLKRFIPVDLIIEVGANIGFIARHAFEHLNPGGTYVCVEPNPEVLPALRKNMKETARLFPGRYYAIVAAAICGRDGGLADFTVRRNLSSSLSPHAIGDEVKTIQVATRTLSSLVKQFAGPYDRLSLICDAEGAEILMLAQDAGAFRRFRQISIELHGKSITNSDVTPDDMIAKFKELGFVLVARDERDCCLFHRRKFMPDLNSGTPGPMFRG